MATLTGKAAIWGNGVYGATATAMLFGTGATSVKYGIGTGADFERFSDVADLPDNDGNTVGRAYYAHGKRFTVTAVPADRVTAFAESAAQTNAADMLPAPGTVIYITDSNSAITDGTFTTAGPTPGTVGLATAARYVCTGSRLRKTNTGAAVAELDLIQYDAYDISVEVS